MMTERYVAAKAVAAVIMAKMAVAQSAVPLATITPCPAAPSSLSILPITVTEQYQPVYTCNPTSSCASGTCTIEYVMTTFDYLSTIIPCVWNGTSASTCTVTATDEPVTISTSVTTLTSLSPAATGTAPVYVNGSVVAPTYITLYQIIEKIYIAPFNQLGPLAMPGWGGSGHCDECDVQPDGSRCQPLMVHECRNGDCRDYPETWVSASAPQQTAPVSAECASSTSVDAAGVYTFAFPQWAPPTTMYAPASTVTVYAGGYPSWSWVPGHWVTAGPQPWTGYVTATCTGPTIIDFTTTLSETVTYTIPYVTASATVTVQPTNSNGDTVNPGLGSTTSTTTTAAPTTTTTTSETTTTTTAAPGSTTTSTTTTSNGDTVNPGSTTTSSTTTTTAPTTTTTTTTETTTTAGPGSTTTSFDPSADPSGDLTAAEETAEPGIQRRARHGALMKGVRRGGRFFKRQA